MGCAQSPVRHHLFRVKVIVMDSSPSLTSSSCQEDQEAAKEHKLKISSEIINSNTCQQEISSVNNSKKEESWHRLSTAISNKENYFPQNQQSDCSKRPSNRTAIDVTYLTVSPEIRRIGMSSKNNSKTPLWFAILFTSIALHKCLLTGSWIELRPAEELTTILKQFKSVWTLLRKKRNRQFSNLKERTTV